MDDLEEQNEVTEATPRAQAEGLLLGERLDQFGPQGDLEFPPSVAGSEERSSPGWEHRSWSAEGRGP